jgi:hypothetical protein
MPFHYPHPENRSQAPLADLSEAARTALGGMATLGTNPADELLQPDSTAEFTSSPAFTIIAETAHSTASQLFERIGVTMPSLAELAAAGIDFERLSSAHEDMRALNLEPRLVIAPVLEAAQWSNLFGALQDDANVNHDGRIKNGGLYIDSEVKTDWRNLQGDEHSTQVSGRRGSWQVVVIPGTEQPDITNIDRRGTTDGTTVAKKIIQRLNNLPNTQLHELHPTIPTYLALQAANLQEHEAPIDSSTWTWLEGEFGNANGLQAPSGIWRPGVGRVGLDWRDVGDRRDNLGVRLPVWG